MQRLKTNKQLESDLNAIKQILIGHERRLKNSKLGILLKTINSDEAKWKNIQAKCHSLLKRAKAIGVELKDTLVKDQMITFIPRATQVETMCGHLGVRTISSTTIDNYKMETDLIELCIWAASSSS